MSKKQLCQIKINNSTGVLPARQYYQCGLNGRYRAHLVHIAWVDSAVNAVSNKLITIQSDCFRMPHGTSSQSIMFNNRPSSCGPEAEYPIDIEVMGNSIDLTVTSSNGDPYSNAGNHVFNYGILTFTVEPITE